MPIYEFRCNACGAKSSAFFRAMRSDGVDYTNPASMANFFRKMGSAFDDEPNEHMDEIVGRLDHGEPVYKALDLDMGGHAGHSHGPASDE